MEFNFFKAAVLYNSGLSSCIIGILGAFITTPDYETLLLIVAYALTPSVHYFLMIKRAEKEEDKRYKKLLTFTSIAIPFVVVFTRFT